MPHDTDLDRRLAAGAAVAREAGRLARRYFERRADLTVEVKGPQDLVSVADRAVEELIRARLSALFPEDAVVGEEAGGLAAARVWVVDPIDGTQNFLRGLPWFGVVLALMVDGRTELGIIYDPNTDELYTARRGGGAFLNGESIRVSGCAQLDKAVIGVGHSPRHAPHVFLEPFTAVIEAGAQTRNLLTAALQLAHVACGRLDATWDPYLLPWDVLAGILLVEEAGGAAAPYQLRPDFSGGAPLLAGTAALVDALRPLVTDRADKE
ncbi:inositol monophosphatase family protein [Azospirillum sp. TSO22-1]|uniref:inositol monophosphatase family protein n=1 Tax=Azospirillum sp. TSO22-1 TaxID=716789 RepID=UPI000D657625|nr:inositol monophosphatase family protein [Azospirillum sp. TSO22-1]